MDGRASGNDGARSAASCFVVLIIVVGVPAREHRRSRVTPPPRSPSSSPTTTTSSAGPAFIGVRRGRSSCCGGSARCGGCSDGPRVACRGWPSSRSLGVALASALFAVGSIVLMQHRVAIVAGGGRRSTTVTRFFYLCAGEPRRWAVASGIALFVGAFSIVIVRSRRAAAWRSAGSARWSRSCSLAAGGAMRVDHATSTSSSASSASSGSCSGCSSCSVMMLRGQRGHSRCESAT